MARPDTRITNYTSENIAEFQMITGGTEHDLPSPISTLFRRWVPALLPSLIIALARSKRNTLSIFLLNCFLGWTLVGWVIALVWAVKTDDYPAPVR
jgi:T4 superinfection immunity protein